MSGGGSPRGDLANEPGAVRCPICGSGTLRTVEFGEQQPGSPEVETFTCGHEVSGAKLETADADRLDVERRTSEETVTRAKDDPGASA
jgi:hypothetical protein